MEHRLNVCACLDTDMFSVRIEVLGCVTVRNYKALLPLLARTKGLAADAQISLDLRDADHLDMDALPALGYTELGEMPHSSQPIRPAQPAAA